MKVIWSAADGFPIAAVEHLIADDAISAWPVLVKHLGSIDGRGFTEGNYSQTYATF